MSNLERQDKFHCKLVLRSIIAEEEIKMRQKAREKHVAEGDENTKYFHLRAKGRRRGITIQSLCQEGPVVQGDVEINKVTIEFYIVVWSLKHILH